MSFSPTSVNGIDALNLFNFGCYPNPSSGSTTISYTLANAENVKLAVYDILGNKIETIVDNSMQQPGTHQIQFDTKNLSKGVYSCMLRTDSGVVTKNLIVE